MSFDDFFAEARELDRQDSLSGFRDEFELDPKLVYLDGNSLGPMPRRSRLAVERTMRDEWGVRLIRSWNDGWIDLPQRLGAKIAGLIGADADEVIVCDSTTVNYFKLLVSACELQSGRPKVVAERSSFPTNLYVLETAVHTENVLLVGAEEQIESAPEAIEQQLNETVALLTLNHVSFKSGWRHDMERLNRAAWAVGALNLWDLSHSVGVVPIDLHAAGTDLAVGCTYKYLNGGPGAPAFLFVRRALQHVLRSPISGWFGHSAPFAFSSQFSPRASIERFLAGTPSILSMAAVEGGVDLVSEAGIERIRSKSRQLTDFCVQIWQRNLEPLGFELCSPLDGNNRGSHISLGHPEAYAICRTLIEAFQIVPDFRQPKTIRFGFSPIFNRYDEVVTAMAALHRVVKERRYLEFGTRSGPVT